MALPIGRRLANLGSLPKSELLDRVPPDFRKFYEGMFRVADEGYEHGRVATSTKRRVTYWQNWWVFVAPLGVDPYLQGGQVPACYQIHHRIFRGSADRIWEQECPQWDCIRRDHGHCKEHHLGAEGGPTKTSGAGKLRAVDWADVGRLQEG